jgi:hypothetical protein
MSASSRGFRRTRFATERTQLRCRKNIYFMRRAITYAILNVPRRDIVPSYEPRRDRYELDHRQSTTPRKSKSKSNVLQLPQKKKVSNDILTLSPTADVCLKLTCNGDVSLWNVANGTEKLVAQASLQLPHAHLDSNFTKATVVRPENAAGPGHGPSKTIVQWGSKEDDGSYAELHITPLRDGGASFDDWMMVSCYYNTL